MAARATQPCVAAGAGKETGLGPAPTRGCGQPLRVVGSSAGRRALATAALVRTTRALRRVVRPPFACLAARSPQLAGAAHLGGGANTDAGGDDVGRCVVGHGSGRGTPVGERTFRRRPGAGGQPSVCSEAPLGRMQERAAPRIAAIRCRIAPGSPTSRPCSKATTSRRPRTRSSSSPGRSRNSGLRGRPYASCPTAKVS